MSETEKTVREPFPDESCEVMANQLRKLAAEIENEECFGLFEVDNDVREEKRKLFPAISFAVVGRKIEMDIWTPNFEAEIDIEEDF